MPACLIAHSAAKLAADQTAHDSSSDEIAYLTADCETVPLPHRCPDLAAESPANGSADSRPQPATFVATDEKPHEPTDWAADP